MSEISSPRQEPRKEEPTKKEPEIDPVMQKYMDMIKQKKEAGPEVRGDIDILPQVNC